MPKKINAPRGDFALAEKTDGAQPAPPTETEWQAFFRELADNTEPDEREALPAHIQE